jgi:uncharacterized protein (TIGR00730 family)
MSETNQIKSICVYCGSADNLSRTYLDGAIQLGKLLALRGFRLIYGAGKTGLMGAVADSVLANGGYVTGVIPEQFNTPQLMHTGLSQLEIVASMHARKARMSTLADAFIALPGGFGTFEELFETLTWAQIGLHTKPVGILNTNHYYDPLVEMVNQARRDGFIYSVHQQLFVIDPDPEILLGHLTSFTNPQGLERWVSRDE